MRLIYLILAALLLLGCNSTKQAAKRLKRLKNSNPELFEADTIYKIKIDTIKLQTMGERFDTIVKGADTIYIKTPELKTEIKIIRDTLDFWRVQTIVKPLTKTVILRDTSFVIKEQVTTQIKYRERLNWYLIALVFLLFLFILRRLVIN